MYVFWFVFELIKKRNFRYISFVADCFYRSYALTDKNSTNLHWLSWVLESSSISRLAGFLNPHIPSLVTYFIFDLGLC